jgi:hypothetical protein
MEEGFIFVMMVEEQEGYVCLLKFTEDDEEEQGYICHFMSSNSH